MTSLWRESVKSEVFTLMQEMKNLKKILWIIGMRKNWKK
uniref:Zinc finger CCCH-type containing 15 n=1 Tax=Molossus molossus TaxID=27622 RepID=A0A7J8FUE7_MOLMO|nr:zinc finger CCCH-type containing 15 [Molossus molossus]